jgi:hypothetical protein
VAVASPVFQKAFPDISGLDKSRCDAVFRRCREEELFEKCRGKNLAELNSADAVKLIFGTIADVPVSHSAKAAQLYYNLRNDGIRAGDYIAQIIDSFDPTKIDDIDFARLAYRSFIVVDLESPRVTVVRECTDGPLEEVFGTKEPRSFETRVSTSKRISGKVLFEISALLNRDYWDSKEKNAA